MKRIIFFSNYVEFILFLHCVDLHYLLKSRVQNDMNYNNVSVFCTVTIFSSENKLMRTGIYMFC